MNAPWKQLSSALLTSAKLPELLQISAFKDGPSKTVISFMASYAYMNEMIFRNPAFQKKGVKTSGHLRSLHTQIYPYKIRPTTNLKESFFQNEALDHLHYLKAPVVYECNPIQWNTEERKFELIWLVLYSITKRGIESSSRNLIGDFLEDNSNCAL